MTQGVPYQFGDYTFPDNGGDVSMFQTNFGNTVKSATKLPGVDGAYLEDGDEPLAVASGSVQVTFYLRGLAQEDLDAARDDVMKMQSYGLQKLWYRPTDAADDVRWTWAVIENIQMSRSKEQYSDVYQKVQVYFHCPDPIWRAGDYGSEVWDGTYVADGTVTADGGAYSTAASGLSTAINITNNGSAYGATLISIECGVGQSVTSPITITRQLNGVNVDRVRYNGGLATGDIITFDGFSFRVEKNGSNVFDDIEYEDPQFIRLAPGSNALVVEFGNAGNATTVSIIYYDTYR